MGGPGMLGALAVLAVAFALVAGVEAARAAGLFRQGRAVRGEANARVGGATASPPPRDAVERYLARLTLRLSSRPPARSASRRRTRGREGRLRRFYRSHAVRAGMSETVSEQAFCEGSVRLSVLAGAAGAVVGSVFSTPLAATLGIVGAVLGWTAPKRLFARAEAARAREAERHLSEMLETIALGLRSGLSFDQSFALYGSHFDAPLAQACASAYRSWSLGLTTREQALRGLADSYACARLERVVTDVVRSLRFGTAIASRLEDEAADARAAYRAEVEERVARAPVKMMLPTGTLILPAMLLLVLGPVLLELVNGF